LPLLCFNAAARHLPFTTLGFLQYVAPTLVLLQAILLFDEHFGASQFLSFACIWAGLAIYSLDIWLHMRRNV
jgi:chloramphenicol-sensitive protein RarD